MRDQPLHDVLQAFATDTAALLDRECAEGAEVPFEVVEADGRRGSPALYCYRALTGEFIEHRMGRLSGLTTYAPAARALASRERAGSYLTMRGVTRAPGDPRDLADAVLLTFLSRVFSDRSDFEFDDQRFEAAYGELEQALTDGRATATVIAPLLGLALEERTWQLELGDGLSLVRGDHLQDAPLEAIWDGAGEPYVLAVLTVTQNRSQPAPLVEARTRFGRVLSATRLFEPGTYGLGKLAWSRIDFGPWRPLALGAGSGETLGSFETSNSSSAPERTLIPARQEDEFRGFCNLMARRLPSLMAGSFGSPEVAWALTRFGMGCERSSPLEAMTDYLLALGALLEPDGPGACRLPQRVALICARPEQRGELAERMAQAMTLERAVISGIVQDDAGGEGLVQEVAEHLRALLRDVLCGHLAPDLVGVAESVLAEELAASPA